MPSTSARRRTPFDPAVGRGTAERVRVIGSEAAVSDFREPRHPDRVRLDV